MTFTEPWYGTDDPNLSAELRRELTPGHVLFRIAIVPLARRRDTDDVLFELRDGTGRVAEVHLTWRAEHDPAFPYAILLESKEAWVSSHPSNDEDPNRFSQS